MLIVVGMGHSGTKFTGRLFKIPHEKFLVNETDYARAWNDKDFVKQMAATLPKSFNDSNSFLVPYIEEIRTRYPSATIIHLIRDPRKVVPSILETNGGTITDIATEWVKINKKLRLLDLPFLRLVDLRGKPVNVHRVKYPAFEEWSKEDKNRLLGVCGKEMKHYGYK